MECKYCGAQLPEEETLCPVCGKDNAVQEQEEVVASAEETAEVISEESVLGEIPEEAPKKKTSPWKIVVAVVASLAVLAALAVAILWGAGIDLKPRENNAQYKDSYTVEAEAAQKKGADVIATIGDRKLTNGELQIHYWMQIYEFLEYYGNYYFDYSKPLDTQYFSEDEGVTWQQYFIDIAIESWRRYTLLSMLAEEENFQLSEEDQKSLDSMEADLEKMAKEYEYASAEEMIRDDMGDGCTLQDYLNYMKLRNISMVYFEKKYNEFKPTQDEISDYYDANKETFESQGMKKEDKTLVDVRHILIRLADGPTDAYGRPDYTEEQWEQCRQQAQAVLDTYLENPTEDNFAELAKQHSVDGNAKDGGIYTDVTQGQMVKEFDSWIFDESRIAGDTDLVKTVYGYHVMYFINREVTEGDWVGAATTQLISERTNAMIEAKGENNPVSVNYKKIVLAENSIG